MYTPPIKERETKQLFEIVSNPNDWQEDALNQAKIELEKRGFSSKEQDLRRNSIQEKKKRILFRKENASYSWGELILIFLFGPFLSLCSGDFSIAHAGEGYKKKNTQAVIAFISGVAFWILLVYFGIL